MHFGDGIKDYQDEIVKTLSELVTIPSVDGVALPGMPYGKACGDALNYILEKASSLGFKTHNLDGHCGWAEFGDGEELAAVLCHLDVVPEGFGWTYPPYGGVVEDGVIYGRGVCDNKGPAVAALYGAKLLMDKGPKPKRRIRIFFGLNEESGMSDVDYYADHEGVPDLAFTPDYRYPLVRGEMGIARILFSFPADDGGVYIHGGHAVNMVPDRAFLELCSERYGSVMERLREAAGACDGLEITFEERDGKVIFTAFGKSAHGSLPQDGCNAVSHLIRFAAQSGLIDTERGLYALINGGIGLEYNGAGLGIAMKDDISLPLTANLGMLFRENGRDYFKLDIRYPITADYQLIRGSIEKISALYGVTVDTVYNSPPSFVDDDAKIVKLLSAVYEKMTGEKAELITIGGGTYARRLKNRCICFGSMGTGAHQPDERVSFSEIEEHSRICAQAIYEMAVTV